MTGEAILPQARTIRDIPLRIPYTGRLEVQGECIMRLSALEKYNETAAVPLKNARNGAAGALRNLDPAVTAARRLSAFFYQVGTIDAPPYHDQPGMLDFIRAQGLPVSPYFRTARTAQEVVACVREIAAARESLDFLIDGAVIKIQDSRTRAALGFTDKFPRWAVAFKFPAEETTTTLESVTWELGRTGKLTPLAHVEAVDFAGVTVRKATLNNYGDIQRKRLLLGCTVWIRRSNDVIPEITGRVEDGSTGSEIAKPTVCPACGASPTCSMTRSTSVRGAPMSRAKYCRFCRTVRSEYTAADCVSYATTLRRSRLPAGRPNTVTVPPAIFCTPTIERIRVVLPHPDGPRRPVT